MTLLIQKNRKQCWPVDQWEDRMLSIQIIGYHLLTDHCRHPNASISFHGPINLSSSLLTDGLHGSRSLLASDWSSLSIPASDWLTAWLFSVKVSSLISRSNCLVNITRKWQHSGSRTVRRIPETKPAWVIWTFGYYLCDADWRKANSEGQYGFQS